MHAISQLRNMAAQKKIKLDSGQLDLKAFLSSVGASNSQDSQPQTGKYLAIYEIIS